jgi:hypothetical protein
MSWSVAAREDPLFPLKFEEMNNDLTILLTFMLEAEAV